MNLIIQIVSLLFAFPAISGALLAQTVFPPTSVPLDETFTPLFEAAEGPCELVADGSYSNFRTVLYYDAPAGSNPQITFLPDQPISLPTGDGQIMELAYEHVSGAQPRVRMWESPTVPPTTVDLQSKSKGMPWVSPAGLSDSTLRLDQSRTVMIRFQTEGDGTLVAKAPAQGEWVEDAKALFIDEGRLVYDIGGVGSMQGRSRVTDGKEHVAVLVLDGKEVRLYLDGKLEARKSEFSRPDPDGSVFKIGRAADDFGGDFRGTISAVHAWERALNQREAIQLSTGREKEVNTSDFQWVGGAAADESIYGEFPGFAVTPKLVAGKGFRLRSAVVQPLAMSNHGELLSSADEASLRRGETIYQSLCVTCHGTLEKPGSLPTAPRFHEATFHNGDDPYRLYQTLHKGYGMMVAQPQYTTAQKYDVIHYLREEFLKEHNPKHYAAVDEGYLRKLPRGMSLRKEKESARRPPQYLLQDFGNVLNWTLQVGPGNIAQKGIALRLDEGPGGITRGKAWALYDHDTMRLAALWTGNQFVDWRGIAFDGSHGTHTSIVGEKHFVFPNEPMWANPKTGKFEDMRIIGRDNRRYGPLPTDWVRLSGIEIHGDSPVIRYTVGTCKIRETIQLQSDGVFVRTLHCGPTKTPLKLRLDAEQTHTIPASNTDFGLQLVYSKAGVKVVSDFEVPLTPPKPPPISTRFTGTLTTDIQSDDGDGPFAVDTLTTPAPNDNPWQSWMRTSGFDFFEGGKSAAICTWNGDVWIVDGIDQAEGELKWQRICAGLFQPLGLKIVEGEIYVGCRDMICKLIDHNDDRETDYIENLNSDHQVTEHFHEFAMGLQTDEEGNFYYAKSARHALEAVVPQHGTLLRVSKDGSKTDILAVGFRAANGVCLNPDGTFIVTDQEGHWNPKNRINWVTGKGEDEFYGNMYGYHNVTDESDEAMIPPLCWITNSFDRSPAELIWVPEDSAWTSLRGSLLNLSYGYGQIYVVPHERVDGQVQGGMCALPLERFPTGIMRGRFHPGDKQLYGCGMFAWAGNQNKPGGFYRIRYTGEPAYLPIALEAAPQTVTLKFTEALDPATCAKAEAWTVKAWDLKRTRNYGSGHYNERQWTVEKVVLSPDSKTATLTLPDLAPTWGMSIELNGKGANGEAITRLIHNSIYRLDD